MNLIPIQDQMVTNTTMNNKNIGKLKRSGASSLNLSSLSLNSNLTEATATSTSTFSRSSNWGSTESRRAYSNLSALCNNNNTHQQSSSSVPLYWHNNGQNKEDQDNNNPIEWGYFVDTPDRDDLEMIDENIMGWHQK